MVRLMLAGVGERHPSAPDERGHAERRRPPADRDGQEHGRGVGNAGEARPAEPPLARPAPEDGRQAAGAGRRAAGGTAVPRRDTGPAVVARGGGRHHCRFEAGRRPARDGHRAAGEIHGERLGKLYVGCRQVLSCVFKQALKCLHFVVGLPLICTFLLK